MNLTDVSAKSKTIAFILGGVIIAVVILILVFGSKGGPKDRTVFPSPSAQSDFIVPPTNPPEELAPTVEQKRQQLLSNQISENNGDITIYENDNYNIKYITAPNVFFVTIYTEPPELYKEEATNWFIPQNLTPQDLCLLNVRFRLATHDLARNNQDFSSLPAGC